MISIVDDVKYFAKCFGLERRNNRVVLELEIMTVIHPSNTKHIIVNVQPQASVTAIFVGGARLLHLEPKFSITGTNYGHDF